MKANLFLMLAVVLTILTSCASLEMPEYRGGETFKLEKLEGKQVRFTAGATVFNPNWFGVKVKPSKFDVFVEDDFVGTVQLQKKVKLKRKKETALSAPFLAELEDGVLLKAVKYMGKGEVNVRFQGTAKAGVFLFSKKMEINKTVKVPTNVLKQGGLKLN